MVYGDYASGGISLLQNLNFKSDKFHDAVYIKWTQKFSLDGRILEEL